MATRPSNRESDRAIALPWAIEWAAWVGAAFVRAYRERATGALFLPADDGVLSMLLDRFVLAKAFRELGAELLAPSERVAVPLAGITHMIGLAAR